MPRLSKGKVQAISIIDEQLMLRLKAEAIRQGRSLSSLIREILKEYDKGNLR